MAIRSKYTDLELESEGHLEDLLSSDPTNIEPGMRLLARQWNTRRGPLDMLLLDQDGRVVVAELKLDEDDEMLMQGLDYLAWVNENLDSVALAFPKSEVAVKKSPRLILIARGFSDLLRARARYLKEDMQPTLLAYRAIQHAEEPLVVLQEIQVGDLPRARPGPPRETEHREYLVGDELRALWDKATELFKSLSSEVMPSPTNTYLGFKHRGHIIGSLYSCKRHFWVLYYSRRGEWGWHLKISKEEDFKQLAEEVGEDYMSRLANSKVSD
jgi:hypothetical protein